MNTKRLLKLAEFLETEVPRNRFDMSTVGDEAFIKSPMACGSAACALGWAPSIPAFKRAGLRLVFDSHAWMASLVMRGENNDPEHAWIRTTRTAAAFFDINRASIEALFGFEPRRQTPKQVARSIRNFVRAAS